MPKVCMLPGKIKAEIRIEEGSHESPHFHAIKGRGSGKIQAQIFFMDEIYYREAKIPRKRFKKKELAMILDWAQRRQNEIMERYDIIRDLYIKLTKC